MAERVVDTNEVSLNSKRYRLAGPIRSSLASIYPPKTVTGDPSKDDQLYASVHTWNDWRGGIGVDRMGPGDGDSVWYSECWLRDPAHLVLPALVTKTSAASGASVRGFVGVRGTTVYSAFGVEIRTFDASNNTWSDPGDNLGAVATDSINIFLGGTEYQVFAVNSGYEYSSNGTAWTNSAKTAYFLTFWDDRLWGLDRSTGQLWYSHALGTEVDDAVLPLEAGSLGTALFVGPDASGEPIIYALTREGLYAHDVANARFVKTNVAVPKSGDLAGVTWNGNIYIASNSLTTIEYNPVGGIVRDISPRDGLPSGYGARASMLISTGRELILGTDPAGSNTAVIMSWDGRGWQIRYAPGNASMDSMLAGFINSEYRVFFTQSDDTDTVHWFALPLDNRMPKEISGYAYAASAIHKTPWFDGGQSEVTKTALEVRIDLEDASSDESVVVAFAKDFTEGADDGSYTTLATVTADGTTALTFPDNGSSADVGTDFRSIRFKLTLARAAGTTTNSPDVTSLTLVYRKKLPAKWSHTFALDMNEDYKGRTSKEQRGDLVSAVETTTKVEFTFRDDGGNTRNFYGDIRSAEGIEQTGHDERGTTRVLFVEL